MSNFSTTFLTRTPAIEPLYADDILLVLDKPSRMSGMFATSSALAHQASRAATASGERIVVFPYPEDYDGSLDSTVADVKQCSMEGEADHILATRFLSRFVGDTPWLHMDLSGHSCKGGLGAVMSDTNGFGVAWGMALLDGLQG